MVCNWPILTSGYRKRDSVIQNVFKLETESCAKPSTVSNSNFLTHWNSPTPPPSPPPPVLKYITFTRFHQISYHQTKGEIVISHTNTAGINRVYRDEKFLGFVNQRSHHSRSSLSWRRCIYKSLLLGQPYVKSNYRNHEPNANHWSKVSG